MQNCAKQVLGRQPVTFPQFYKTEPEALRCFVPGYEFLWNPKWSENQWWIDAFTCDPRLLGRAFKCIRFRGDPPPVQQNDILNASVGRLPVMMVYIAVHQEFGTRIYYPYHGAKAGKKAAYQNYKYWCRQLTPREVAHLNDILYYNQPQAHKGAKQAGCRPGAAFNPELFRVRLLH